MKKNKTSSQMEIPAKNEVQAIRRGASKNGIILIAFVCLLVGFILGATVAILKMSEGSKAVAFTGDPQKEASVDREEEIKLLKAALGKDPSDLPTLIELGNAYFDTDRYQEAIDAYSKALAIDPKNPEVRTDMGIMYRKLARFDQAIEAFRQAARDQPMHVNSRFNLGVVLKYDKEDFQGAIQAWEEFLKVVPPDDERIPMVKKEIQDMKSTLFKK